jgi:Pretoxin HINT domain
MKLKAFAIIAVMAIALTLSAREASWARELWGTVQCAGSGQPAVGVTVVAYAQGIPTEACRATTTTDANGHFEFNNQMCALPSPTCTCNCYYVTIGNITRGPFGKCPVDVDTGLWSITCGGGSCFLAGTKIRMADGSSQAVEMVSQNDRVLGFNQLTGKLEASKVNLVHPPAVSESYLIINDILRVTNEHPFLSNGQWVPIGKLRVGDTLTDQKGSPVPITSIETIWERVSVYNFAVEGAHNYIAEGFVAHNKNPPEDEEPPDLP